MARRTISARQRAEAMRLYRIVGTAEASRRTGIKESTIRKWATLMGMVQDEGQLEGAAAEAAITNKGMNQRGTITAETYDRLAAIRRAEAMAAIEAAHTRQAVLREELRTGLLDKAIDALHRMDEEHVDFKGKDATEVHYPKAPAPAFQAYATSAAILLDKYRLEVGESTSRAEVELRAHIEQVSLALGLDPATVWVEAERLVADGGDPLQLMAGIQRVIPAPEPAVLPDPPAIQDGHDEGQ